MRTNARIATFAMQLNRVITSCMAEQRNLLIPKFQNIITMDGGDDDFAEIEDTVELAKTLIAHLNDFEAAHFGIKEDEVFRLYNIAKDRMLGED